MNLFLSDVCDLEGLGRKYLPLTDRVKQREKSILFCIIVNIL